MKKYIVSSVLLLTLILPVFAFAQDDTDPQGGVSSCVALQSTGLRYKARDSATNGEVSSLQDFLQSQNYLSSEPSGYFGLLTVKAVKDFQKANGISPTGYVGSATRAKISSATNCGTQVAVDCYDSNLGRMVSCDKSSSATIDAQIKTYINTARAQAEVYYDSHRSYAGVCLNSNNGIYSLMTKAAQLLSTSNTVGGISTSFVYGANGGNGSIVCHDSIDSYAFTTSLKQPNLSHAGLCSDSTGRQKEVTSFTANTLSCPDTTNTPSQKFNVTFPTSGATLYQGETYNFTWTGQDLDSTGSVVSSYSVFLQNPNVVGQTLFGGSPIGQAFSNQKVFTYTIPSTVPPGSGYKLSFNVATSNWGGESPSFTIATKNTSLPAGCSSTYGYSTTTGESCGKPVATPLRIIYPSGGETFYPGQTYTIRWTGSMRPDVGQYQVNLNTGYNTNNITYKSTDIGTTSKGEKDVIAFYWTVPSDISPGNDYSISLSSNAEGVTSNTFSIGTGISSTCSTSGYDTRTGFKCGCSSTSGWSSTTGESCGTTTTPTTTACPTFPCYFDASATTNTWGTVDSPPKYISAKYPYEFDLSLSESRARLPSVPTPVQMIIRSNVWPSNLDGHKNTMYIEIDGKIVFQKSKSYDEFSLDEKNNNTVDTIQLGNLTNTKHYLKIYALPDPTHFHFDYFKLESPQTTTPTTWLHANEKDSITIQSGQAVNLTWGTNGSYCYGNGGMFGGTNGSLTVYPTQTTTYDITCVSEGHYGYAHTTVTVNSTTVNPSNLSSYTDANYSETSTSPISSSEKTVAYQYESSPCGSLMTQHSAVGSVSVGNGPIYTLASQQCSSTSNSDLKYNSVPNTSTFRTYSCNNAYSSVTGGVVGKATFAFQCSTPVTINTTANVLDVFKSSPSTPTSTPNLVFTPLISTEVGPSIIVQTINSDLVINSKGNNVKILQKFLIDQNVGKSAQTLKESGLTGNFGQLTKSALAEWQKSVGINPASGNFGLNTRMYIEKLH